MVSLDQSHFKKKSKDTEESLFTVLTMFMNLNQNKKGALVNFATIRTATETQRDYFHLHLLFPLGNLKGKI